MSLKIRKRLFAALLTLVSLAGFCWPGAIVLRAILDQSLATATPSSLVLGWHRALTPRFAQWARLRVASGVAATLSGVEIAGTEWPMYGAVFYLRATENLQNAWELDPRGLAPKEYARVAVEASAALIADPGHASWVRQHWGDGYLQQQNLFYRMLLIDGLATHLALTGSNRYRDLLATQTDSLALELDKTADGLLDDYPGQCYPVDVVSAWSAIFRADRLLGHGHTQRIQRGLRGFVGSRESPQHLPPYFVDRRFPNAQEAARGSSSSGLLFSSPWLWPTQSRRWYAQYERQYWRRGFWLAGFREFPDEVGDGLYFDVDAGPVVAGLGTAASGLGVAASRSMGRFDHARPLALEMIAASWPLPNGRLALARAVSDGEHAPYMAEAVILFALSQPTAPGFTPTPGGSTPGMVWALLAFYWGTGVLMLAVTRRLWSSSVVAGEVA